MHFFVLHMWKSLHWGSKRISGKPLNQGNHTICKCGNASKYVPCCRLSFIKKIGNCIKQPLLVYKILILVKSPQKGLNYFLFLLANKFNLLNGIRNIITTLIDWSCDYTLIHVFKAWKHERLHLENVISNH